MSTITAALITGREAVEFLEFADAPPAEGCVTVDVSLCGICGTDIASYRSGHLHQPSVCGHEWVGTVAAVGPGDVSFELGDRVVIAVPTACGHCAECRLGAAEYCRTVSTVARGRDALAPPHGGFARRVTVSATRLMHAHPGLSDEQAAQVEPATVAFHGVRRSNIALGDTVAVQGAGPIGLFAAQFARAAGAGRVVVIEPTEHRRRVSLSLGVDHAVAPADASTAILDLTGGAGADVVIECAGVPSLLQTAADLARAGGTVSLLSFLAQPATIEGAKWLARQQTMVASNAFTRDDFRRSMELIADGRVRTEPLHTRTVSLGQFADTLAELARGGGDDIKVLVDPR